MLLRNKNTKTDMGPNNSNPNSQPVEPIELAWEGFVPANPPKTAKHSISSSPDYELGTTRNGGKRTVKELLPNGLILVKQPRFFKPAVLRMEAENNNCSNKLKAKK